MKVSIIIPVYNRVKELDRSLCSLDEQTFKDFEVVIVDDGSAQMTIMQVYLSNIKKLI